MARLCVVVAIALVAAHFAVAVPIVETTLGPVQGTTLENTTTIGYFGIPFAEPPIQDLRFKPPVPKTPWTGVWDGTVHGSPCLQLRITSIVITGQEDCLFLDVYVPAGTTPTSNLPVMIWIHGGGFVIGGARGYNGAILAENQNVIVVMIQYRLNAFGFLALPELLAESGTAGAYGLLDQQLAIKWVKANAAAFGGNPNQITLFGESAGGMSVCSHLVMPSSAGLFQAAIMQSATCDAPEFFPEFNDAVDFGRQYLKDIGCDGTGDDLLVCIRKLRGYQLLDPLVTWLNMTKKVWDGPKPPPHMWPVMPWGASFTDAPNHPLKDRPYRLLAKGEFNKVPVIMGTNKNEGSAFYYLIPFVTPEVPLPVSDKNVIIAAEHFYDTKTAQAVVEQYPPLPLNPLSGEERMMQITRDFFFTCATRRALRAIRKGGAPAYQYEFTFSRETPIYNWLGDTHGAEIAFVFGTVKNTDADDLAMISTFQDHWGLLAKTGNPNCPEGKECKLLNWPLYDANNDSILEFSLPTSIRHGLHTANCNFWDKWERL